MSSYAHAPPNPDKAIRVQRTSEYPHEVWFFIACLISLVFILRLLALICSRVFKRKLALSQGSEHGFNTQSTNRRLRLRHLPLALVNLYRMTAFRSTVDFGSFSINLAEVVFTLMYMAALFIWTFINTTDVAGIKFDENYWSNRAGALAASQFPLITALGTKNNAISWITGVPYEKLHYTHRMAARVVFVLSWVHAGSKALERSWPSMAEPVRARAYEFFFCTHITLVLLILVGIYYHTKQFSFQTYVWPSFIIWGVDRAIRAFRLILFNHSRSGGESLHATTELLTPELVRLTLKRPQHFKWSPGQIVYLITPGVSTLPFESHPFTIASYDSQASHKEPTSSAESCIKELVFLINVQKGFTKRLARIAARKGIIKTYIDGPYGLSHDSSSYNTIVFIAGGTGVSYTLPLLLDTIEGARRGSAICQRATFIWCIRDSAHIRWISDVLAQALTLAPETLKIDIRIFVTGSRASDNSDLRSYDWAEESGTTTAESTPAQTPVSEKGVGLPNSDSVSVLSDFSSVRVSHGRPTIATLLMEEAEETRGGSMWVTVCGSHSIANAVRKGLRFPVFGPSAVLRGGASVTLHVESFGYA